MNYIVRIYGTMLSLQNGMSSEQLFDIMYRGLVWRNADMAPFMKRLKEIAAGQEIVEFGVSEGQSTFAFLCGKAKSITSYDIRSTRECYNVDAFKYLALKLGIDFNFVQADTTRLERIPDCDMLMIDSLHNFSQVVKELKHAPSARKLLVLHDTVGWAESDEGANTPITESDCAFYGLPADDARFRAVGIRPALDLFLDTFKEKWEIAEHYPEGWGLTVCKRK